MGQQQLLLLILAAVIVGVAIVLGINMFAQNSAQANQEAVMQDVLTISSRAQAWYRRPIQLGGGGRTFDNLTLVKLNFPASNANGSFSVTGSGNTATVTGTGVENAGGNLAPLQIQVTVYPDSVGAATITQ